MAEKLLICCQRVTAITTDSGSIRKILIGSRTPMTVAQVSRSTAEKRGRPKTTSQPRSFTTFQWTTLFPITFTARNRTIRVLLLQAGQIGVQSGQQIGSQSAAANAASFWPTRATGTSSIQTTKTQSIVTTRSRKKSRTLASCLLIIPVTALPILFIVFSG